ncbi:MAG: tetratricopeptide repeat protein [Planctomycetota bacterium]|jgi:tetratricopeptide (TPR) repeat protein
MRIAAWSALLVCATMAYAGSIDVSDAMKRANGHLRSGERGKAIGLLREIVDHHPEVLQAHLLYQQAMRDAGRSADLQPHYREQAERAPDDPQAGFLYLRLLRGRSAAGKLRRFTREHKDYAPGWIAYCHALRRNGQLKRAGKAAATAVRLAPQLPEAIYARGWIRDRLGDTAAAEKDYRKAIAMRSDYPQPRYRLAHLLARARPPKAAEALRVLKDAQRLAPDDSRHCVHKGIVLGTLGRDREAIAAYEDALQRAGDDPLVLVLLADAYSDLSEWKLAERAADKALTLSPTLAAAHATRGYIDLRQGRLKESAAAFRRAARNDPASGSHIYYLGLIHERSGALRQAVTCYRRACSKSPYDVAYRLAHGMALEKLDRLHEAYAAYRDAVRRAPDDADLWIRLGHVAADLRRPKKAVAAWKKALEIVPKDTEVLLSLGVTLETEMHDRDEALDFYRRYVAAGGSDSRVPGWIENLEKQTDK